MHYLRWYRTGEPGEAEARLIRGANPTGLCTHGDCGKPVKRGSERYCSMHQARGRRHGDMDVVKTPSIRRGADNPSWRGDAVTYSGAHARVRKLRGRASDHRCVDCLGQATHWAYRHGSPSEVSGEWVGFVLAYSPDPMDYDPRCTPCHKAYDLAELALKAR